MHDRGVARAVAPRGPALDGIAVLLDVRAAGPVARLARDASSATRVSISPPFAPS
jgi:hypothetical protein